MKIKVKALSVNKCWQGRRFKTPEYKVYEKEILYSLPKDYFDLKHGYGNKGKLRLIITFGVSSKNADTDNCVKPFLDLLQKKYGFNDRQVYKIEAEKVDVKKGEEFINFEIESYF